MKSDFEFKSDWQLFRQRIAGWQERYMERLLQGYAGIIAEDGSSSDRFWELEKRIREDKRHIGVVMEMRRTFMIRDITRLIDEDVIGYDDLEGFSDKFLDRIKHYRDVLNEG